MNLRAGEAGGLEILETRIPWPQAIEGPDPSKYYGMHLASPDSEAPGLQLLSPAVGNLEHYLRKSLVLRTAGTFGASTNIVPPAPIAILFSGGLDCTLLACIIDDILPRTQEIDLLNVAFENPRVLRAADPDKTSAAYCECPDRQTGLSSFAELQRVCPQRTWRFVSIDVPYAETLAERPKITSLMYPHNTEMDLSIACALYFAARGKGNARTHTSQDVLPYTTSARILLSGLGADELFAGYTRHATAFSRKGYPGLAGELKLDFERLGKRNLGRDDRVIARWGREVRYPYLDEEFLKWALQLPPWEKCGFGQADESKEGEPVLEPSKKLLRLLAWKLGMKSAATEKKRAIQFGARTAKMEAAKTKGTAVLN
ncbi:MAG: hypothetical protein Q9222_003278 [Ikaeria aurantiellina]